MKVCSTYTSACMGCAVRSMHGVRGSMHGVCSSMHGVCGSMHGVCGSMHGVRSSMHGVCGSMHGVRSSMHGVRSSMHGVCSSMHKMFSFTVIVLNYHGSCRDVNFNILILRLQDNINEFRLLQHRVIEYGNESATGGGRGAGWNGDCR